MFDFSGLISIRTTTDKRRDTTGTEQEIVLCRFAMPSRFSFSGTELYTKGGGGSTKSKTRRVIDIKKGRFPVSVSCSQIFHG